MIRESAQGTTHGSHVGMVPGKVRGPGGEAKNTGWESQQGGRVSPGAARGAELEQILVQGRWVLTGTDACQNLRAP